MNNHSSSKPADMDPFRQSEIPMSDLISSSLDSLQEKTSPTRLSNSGNLGGQWNKNIVFSTLIIPTFMSFILRWYRKSLNKMGKILQHGHFEQIDNSANCSIDLLSS